MEDCDRKFFSYFSMMRHVAFTHRREKTMRLMKFMPDEEPEAKQRAVSNPLLRAVPQN